MTKQKYFRVAVLMAAALASSGCNPFKKSRPKTPVVGERIAVLTSETDVQVNPAAAGIPVTLPAAAANEDWAQSGGNAAKSMGHVALGNALAVAFSVQAGRGSSVTARLASEPVVGGGRVFTI